MPLPKKRRDSSGNTSTCSLVTDDGATPATAGPYVLDESHPYGRGTNGRVVRGHHRQSGERVAVKVMVRRAASPGISLADCPHIPFTRPDGRKGADMTSASCSHAHRNASSSARS